MTSMGNRSEGDGKDDKSCSDGDSERVGRVGNAKGIVREGNWLFVEEWRGDDVAKTDDKGKNNKGSDASYSCDDGQMCEGIGTGMANGEAMYCERATEALSRIVVTTNGGAIRARVRA